MDFLQQHPAEQIAAIMRRIYERGLTTASGGNISILNENGDLWITPKAVDKGGLTAADMICVHPDNTAEGIHSVSSELPFHRAAYRARPDARAVLHAHPVYCIAYSLTRTLPRVDLLPETERFCRNQRLAKYAMTGSRLLGEHLYSEFSKGADVVFLENHGVCVAGSNLLEAYQRFELMEYAAQLELLAKKLGAPRGLSREQLALAAKRAPLDELETACADALEQNARAELIQIIRRAYAQKLFTGAQGAFSVRLNEGAFLISPDGLDNAEMCAEDLILLRKGKAERGKSPSALFALHAALYERQPAVNAVCSAQPASVMAFAATNAKFETYTIPESFLMLREVPKYAFEEPYLNPETAATRFSSQTPVVLFENNCIVTTGESPFQAFDRLEVAEATASSILFAREAGEVVLLSEAEILELKTTFHIE